MGWNNPIVTAKGPTHGLKRDLAAHVLGIGTNPPLLTWGDVSYEEFSTLVGTWGNSTGLVRGVRGRLGVANRACIGRGIFMWGGTIFIHFRSNQTLRFPIRNWISWDATFLQSERIVRTLYLLYLSLFCFASFVTTNFPHQFLYLAQPMVYHWYFSLLGVFSRFLPRFLAGWTWAPPGDASFGGLGRSGTLDVDRVLTHCSTSSRTSPGFQDASGLWWISGGYGQIMKSIEIPFWGWAILQLDPEIVHVWERNTGYGSYSDDFQYRERATELGSLENPPKMPWKWDTPGGQESQSPAASESPSRRLAATCGTWRYSQWGQNSIGFTQVYYV